MRSPTAAPQRASEGARWSCRGWRAEARLAERAVRRVTVLQGDKKDRKRKAKDQDAIAVVPKRSKGEGAIPSTPLALQGVERMPLTS
jgi:hypothetical protein